MQQAASPRGPSPAPWTLLGLASGVYIVSALAWNPAPDALQLVMLFYQPFVPGLAMLWCWVAAVRHWERAGIRYAACFGGEDARKLPSGAALLSMASAVSSLLALSAALFLHSLGYGGGWLALWQARLAYAGVALFLVWPGTVFYGESRRFFGQTVARVLVPTRAVSWADFLLADCVTSLAKSLGDLARAACAVAPAGAGLEGALARCPDSLPLVPVGLVAPYVIRFVQCLRVYHDTGNRNQVFNAIKYSTMFPVAALAAAGTGVVDPALWQATLRPLWVCAALTNSAYSYFWDVERDWEISFFSQMGAQSSPLPQPVLSSPSLHPRAFYLYLMASNLLLRLGWTYKLSDSLRTSALVPLLFAVVEVLRRFQWLFVRVEVELRKLQALRPSDLAVERSSALDEVEHGGLELAEAKGRAHTKAPAHFGASSPKAALRSKGLETS